MFIINALLISALLICSSPVAQAGCIGHVLTAIISLLGLKYASRYYLFWLIFLIVISTSSSIRFSLEYFLLAAGLFACGANSKWLNTPSRKLSLSLVFVLLFAANQFKIGFYERGSLLIWLPVFLAAYFPLEKAFKSKAGNLIINALAGIALFVSNKITSFVAFITLLRSKILYALLTGSLIIGLISSDKVSTFISKSFMPRVHIWLSTLNGFWDSPLWGHGFGTFSLDFPEYRAHTNILGARIGEQVVHGHSTLFHYLFELGLVGILIIGILFFISYKKYPLIIAPLTVIICLDASLVNFNQFFLAGLILIPLWQTGSNTAKQNLLSKISKEIPTQFKKPAHLLISLIAFGIFTISITGHYHYTFREYDQAINWDKYNSLYHFTRGADMLNQDSSTSLIDFKRAIELNPDISYYHGFLAAANLAENNLVAANQSIDKAIKLDGRDGYWYLIKAFSNYQNKDIYNKYLKKAYKLNPEIKSLLSDPNETSSQYIGQTRKGDPRISGFYRTGQPIFYPLPIVAF